MPSAPSCGQLLRTLIASKPAGHFLELGTGIGLSLSWILDGMDSRSSIVSLDDNPALIEVVGKYLSSDPRVELICTDGSSWLNNYSGVGFDLIFADSWPGKYSDIDLALSLVRSGGFYVIDDMLPRAKWSQEHGKKANALVSYLENHERFYTTVLDWSTGIVMCTKKN